MNIIKKMKCKIPDWAMSAIFNSDCSGLFENDITFLESWLAWVEVESKKIGASSWIVAEVNNKPYSDGNPSFGLSCNVYDCVVLFFE